VVVAVGVADKKVAVAGSDRLVEMADRLAEAVGKVGRVEALDNLVDNLVEVVGFGNLCTSWHVLDFVLGRRHIGGSSAGLAYVLDETCGWK
jgi:hypothetical protein